MKKRFILAAILSLCLVSCGDKNSSNTSDKETYDGYYESIANKEGQELVNSLHTLMNDFTFVSYGGLGPAYVKTDSMEDENGELKVVDFYTHKLMKIPSDEAFGLAYNREHVWPRSLFSDGKAKQSPANSDLQHVRPDFYELNNYRGNSKYGVVNNKPATGFKQLYGTSSFDTQCFLSNNVFEPNDISKGDCARICLYVAVTHNFDILDVFDGDKETVKKTLMEWNDLDPVDEIETKRNEEAFKIQNNRNAFIDHNELFDIVVEILL